MPWPPHLNDNSEFELLGEDATVFDVIEAAIRTSEKQKNGMGAPFAYFGLSSLIEERVMQFEPFSAWARLRIFHDESQQGMPAERGWAEWIVKRISEGWAAAQIVERATEWVKSNSALFHDVFVVSGLNVEQPAQLDAGVFLVRPDDLQDLWNIKRLFEVASGPVQDAGARSALVIQYEVSPIAGHPKVLTDDEAKAFMSARTMPVPQNVLRELVAKQARQALVLAGDGPIELVAHYTSPADADHPAPYAPAAGRFDFPPLPKRSSNVNLLEASRLLKLLRAFRPDRTMGLAIDRIARARLEYGANAAIDLGIALDVMLRHEDETLGDITAKVVRRTSLLLKDDQFAKQAEALFVSRSAAVHSGEFPFLWGKFNQKEADQLCVSVAEEILKIGAFPDWKAFGESDLRNPKTPYERLCIAWDKASAEERDKFLARASRSKRKQDN